MEKTSPTTNKRAYQEFYFYIITLMKLMIRIMKTLSVMYFCGGSKTDTVSITDLDQGSEMIIFKPIIIIFKASFIFGGHPGQL